MAAGHSRTNPDVPAPSVGLFQKAASFNLENVLAKMEAAATAAASAGAMERQ